LFIGRKLRKIILSRKMLLKRGKEEKRYLKPKED